MDLEDLKEWGNSENVLITEDLKKMFVFGETVLYLRGNEVFVHGKQRNGLLSNTNTEEYANNAKLLAYNNTRFRDFTTNGYHALAISENGDLFSWGNNDYFELGRCKNTSSHIDLVTMVLGISVSQAVCGENFSFVLTEEGKLIEWGYYGGKVYELNFSNDNDISSDKDISNGKDITTETEDLKSKKVDSIICTKYYPMALTKTGKVFLPKLPRYATSKELLSKEQLQEFEFCLKNKKVVQLLNGKNYVYALTNDGEIYRWSLFRDNAKNPELVDVKFGRAIKLWTTTSADIVVATNSYGKLFSICGINGQIFVSELTFSSVGKYFSTKRLPLEGPLYVNMYNKDQNVIKAADCWKEKFKLAFNKKDGSDIAFNLDGQLIYAHEAIVCIQSSYLEAMLKNNWSENADNRVIKIKNYTYATYLRFLQYMYTGDLDLSSHEMNLELLQLSHEYKDETLLKMCEKIVETGITIDNVYSTYKLVSFLELMDLGNICKIFMGRHLENIFFSDEIEDDDKESLVCFMRDMICSRNIHGKK